MKCLLAYEEMVWDLGVDLLHVLPFGTKLPWHSSNGDELIGYRIQFPNHYTPI
jgi:hypothetical protein